MYILYFQPARNVLKFWQTETLDSWSGILHMSYFFYYYA